MELDLAFQMTTFRGLDDAIETGRSPGWSVFVRCWFASRMLSYVPRLCTYLLSDDTTDRRSRTQIRDLITVACYCCILNLENWLLLFPAYQPLLEVTDHQDESTCDAKKVGVALVIYSLLSAAHSNIASVSKYVSSNDSGNQRMLDFPTMMSTVFFSLQKTFCLT